MSLLDTVTPFVEAGFAIHWLHPREKRPVGDNWQQKPVASLDALKRRFLADYNVGVRLGEFSAVEGGYLHVLDVDIRAPEHAAAAWARLSELFPGVDFRFFPTVQSGSGGESRHVYLVTDQAFRSRKLARSPGFEMVFDPKQGRDVRKQHWEIELFGNPKQVAMPPSIHPDTGLPYKWLVPFDLDVLELGCGPLISSDLIIAAGAAVDDGDDDFEINTDRLGLSVDETWRILNTLSDHDDTTWLHERDGWRNIGMALKHEYGEDGWDIWLEYSQRSSKFNLRTQKEQWKSFKGKTKRPIRMASLKAAAQLYWYDTEGDEFDDLEDVTPRSAASEADEFEDLDAPTDEFSALLGGGDAAPASEETWNGGELTEEERKLDWRSLRALNKDGEIISNLHNLELILKNDPRLVGVPQINEFTQETVQRVTPGTKVKKRKNSAKETRQLTGRVWQVKDTLNGETWTSARDYSIRSILEAPGTQGGYGIKVTDRDLKAAIVLAAWENTFHPVREYLSGLVWDGVSRVETLFIDYLGAEDNAYARQIARLLLIAAACRVFEPGHKWDFAVILEGLQGRGKSTFIRTLGKRWFSELEGDWHDGKELVEKMQGAWIMEIPELSGFNRADVRSIKAFISRQVDKVRLAYEARAAEFPRQCVFIGSTNDREYLKDDSGGRRFFPMECNVEMIDIPRLRTNVDQLWAEAYVLYQGLRAEYPDGEELPLYLMDAEAAAEAARLQESRRVESSDDALVGRITAWLDSPIQTGSLDEEGEGGIRNITCLVDVWHGLGNDPKAYGPSQAQSYGRAMTRVQGWRMTGKTFSFPYPVGRQRFYERLDSPGILEPIGKKQPS